MIGAYILYCEDALENIINWHYHQGVTTKYFIHPDHHGWNIKPGPELITISPFKAKELYEKGELDKIIIPTCLEMDIAMDTYLKYERLGFKSEDICFAPISLYYGKEPDEHELITIKNLTYAQHLEFHLTHRCNLNCGGCNHFIPCIPKEEEIDYDTMI